MVQQRSPDRQRAAATSRTVSIPAPTGGWNARDNLDGMPATDAQRVINFVPEPDAMRLRGGSKEYATGVGTSDVETLAEYNSGAVKKLFATGSGKIYDVTGGGSAILFRSGFSNDRWQFVNFNGFLGMVNGSDHPQTFDGSTFVDMDFTVLRDDGSDTNGWTVGTNWAHDSADDEFDHSTGNTASLDRDITLLVQDVQYEIEVDTANRTQGSVDVGISGTTKTISTNGTTTFLFVASSSSDTINFTPTSDFDGSISGVRVRKDEPEPSKFVGIVAFKNRTFFWEKDSQDFWFSKVNALGGDLTKFPLSRVGQFGGRLFAVVPWTTGGAASVDEAGVSLQQLIAFVMSSGEILVYRGSDPSSADWALVGLYRVGPPIDVRATLQIAGDAVIVTRDGAMPMSAIMQQGQFTPRVAITDKIRSFFGLMAEEHVNKTGWQALFYPSGPWIVVNVPITDRAPGEADSFVQLAMHTVTEGWFRIEDWNTPALGTFDDRLFFGTQDGRVVEADINEDDEGALIDGEVRQAYTPMGGRGQRVRTMAAAPTLSSNQDLTFGFELETDFTPRGSPIDEMIDVPVPGLSWDSIFIQWRFWTRSWGEKTGVPFQTWLLAHRQAFTVAPRVRVRTKHGASWVNTTVQLTPAGGLG